MLPSIFDYVSQQDSVDDYANTMLSTSNKIIIAMIIASEYLILHCTFQDHLFFESSEQGNF